MTERDIFDVLKTRYPSNEYALIPQVRNQTGFGRKVRTADALAISLWPSKGIDLHGFEFKDSRTDWLKELADSSKSEEIGRFCSFWWIVASKKEIVLKDELPKMWGLIVLDGDSSKIVVKAPRREHEQPTLTFLASILKSAQDTVTGEADIQKRINSAVRKATDGHYAEVKKSRDDGIAEGLKRGESLVDAVNEFNKASGLNIPVNYRDSYGHSKKLGEAVKFVMDGGMSGIDRRLLTIIGTCDELKAIAKKALETQ